MIKNKENKAQDKGFRNKKGQSLTFFLKVLAVAAIVVIIIFITSDSFKRIFKAETGCESDAAFERKCSLTCSEGWSVYNTKTCKSQGDTEVKCCYRAK